MPVFKTEAVVEFLRDVRLSFRVEAALTGLGSVIGRSVRSRLGKPQEVPVPAQRTASEHSQSPEQGQGQPIGQPRKLEQVRQQLESKNQKLEQVSQQLDSKAQKLNNENQSQEHALQQQENREMEQLAEQRRKLEQIQQRLKSKDQELNGRTQELAGKDQEQEQAHQKSKSRELAELQNQTQGGLPLPPPRKIFLVTGNEDAAGFLKSGEMAAQSIREILENNGLNIEGFGSMLEFGCGVGRILRHWSTLEETEVHGTDYNPELISWCKENLTFAEFRVNDLVGGFTYEDEKFDFIYAWSVFTHLTEEQQFFWIEELSRVVRPGGYLFITTHGEPYLQEFKELYSHHLITTYGESYLQQLVNNHGESVLESPMSPEEQERFRNGQLVVLREEVAGSNECNTFHPQEYVYEKLARGLEVIDFVPGGAEGSTQDVYLLRKP